MLNRKPVSQSKAGHLGFRVAIKKIAPLLCGWGRYFLCIKTSVITAQSIITKVKRLSYVTYMADWLLSIMEVANDTPLPAPG